MKYELEQFHRDIPHNELLADLRRIADELGKNRVTFREYNERGRFTAGTLARRFGSWNAALNKRPSTRQNFSARSIGISRIFAR